GRVDAPPRGRDERRRHRGARVLLRSSVWGRLRTVWNLLVPADPVRPVLAVPPGVLRLLGPAHDGRRLGLRRWPWLGPWPGPAGWIRAEGARVAPPPARRGPASGRAASPPSRGHSLRLGSRAW